MTIIWFSCFCLSSILRRETCTDWFCILSCLCSIERSTGFRLGDYLGGLIFCDCNLVLMFLPFQDTNTTNCLRAFPIISTTSTLCLHSFMQSHFMILFSQAMSWNCAHRVSLYSIVQEREKYKEKSVKHKINTKKRVLITRSIMQPHCSLSTHNSYMLISTESPLLVLDLNI